MSFAAALTAFVGYGFVTWAPAFLIRSYGMSTGEIGTWFGLILGIPGGIGIVMGGWLADKFGAKIQNGISGPPPLRWYLRNPIQYYRLLAADSTMALLGNDYSGAARQFLSGHNFSQTQGISELRMRAVAAGILLFIINIIGLGFGPQVVGVISDILSDQYGTLSLRYALFMFSLVIFGGRCIILSPVAI